MANPKQPEPELPETTRRETEVEREAPSRIEDEESDLGETPQRRDAEESDLGEVPAGRGAHSGEIERDDGPPPGREGHDREMQERRPHRDEPI